jgi:hypothetical protein
MSFVSPERSFGCQPGPLSAVLADVDSSRGRLDVQIERSPDVFAALAAPGRGALLLSPPGDAPVTALDIVRVHRALTGDDEHGSPIRDEHAKAPSRWRPWETPGFLLDALVAHHDAAVVAGLGHPVVLTAAFLLDFLTLCPLIGDNRRTARVLAVRMLAWHGHSVVRYADVEDAVFGREADDALAASQEGWAEGQHCIWPWTTHVVEALAEAYAGLGQRIAAGAGLRGHSKQERVRRYVLDYADDTFRISQIRDALPEVSDGTIRLALETLKRDGRIELRTPGRDAAWHRLDRRGG